MGELVTGFSTLFDLIERAEPYWWEGRPDSEFYPLANLIGQWCVAHSGELREALAACASCGRTCCSGGECCYGEGCRPKERGREDGLTDAEGVVSDALVQAVGAWARLPRQHPQEINEFVDGIHRCQGLLATRIARRIYPDGWPVK